MRDWIGEVGTKLHARLPTTKICYYRTPDGVYDTFVLIRPYEVEQSSLSASNKSLQTAVTFQIDVQSTNRMTCRETQATIEETLKELGYYRLNGQELDDYLDNKHYVLAYRYKMKTKLYEVI